LNGACVFLFGVAGLVGLTGRSGGATMGRAGALPIGEGIGLPVIAGDPAIPPMPPCPPPPAASRFVGARAIASAQAPASSGSFVL
jgi:hypothetical protein